MKRKFLVIAVLAALALPASLNSQDSPTAAAEREQAEERHRTLTKRLDGIEESFAALQKNVTSLREEVRRLKDELERSRNKNDGGATQESIKYLAEKIEEVDKKRLNDSELVRKQFAELRKFVLESPGSPRLTSQPPSGGTAPRGNPGNQSNQGSTTKPIPDKQPGWTYKIKDKDTLAKIVAALRKQNINVTQKQIEQANEGVKWNNLQIGQEIFIPEP